MPWGDIVFYIDWIPAPYHIGRMTAEEAEDNDGVVLAMRIDPETVLRLLLKNIDPSMFEGQQIMGILARNDGTEDSDLRYLVLSEEIRNRLRQMGIRWLVFRVGDKALLIDLDKLEADGEYCFGVDPDASCKLADENGAIAAVWHEGELLEVMYEPEETALNGTVILTEAADA